MNWFKKPSTTGGIVYLVVVGMVVVGLILVAVDTWRAGVIVIGLGFALAFAARLVLPDNRAGMLRVRRRLIDLAVLGVCSGVMIAMAIVIPNRPNQR